jgi:polyisoprenoid-binding protein YceI
MKTLLKRFAIFAAVIAAGAVQAIAQPVYKLDQSKSELLVNGTSTVHNWTMEAGNLKCQFEMDLNGNKTANITGITFSVAAKDLKSESDLMDKKAHEALKSDKSPLITFSQTTPASFTTVADGSVSGTITGNLSIAGKVKKVEVSFRGKIVNDKLVVTGKLPVKMSEFGIEPPVAMLGALKTGDEVTLEYSFEFIPGMTSSNN